MAIIKTAAQNRGGFCESSHLDPFGPICHACLTLGSECPAAPNVVLRNCRINGASTLLNLKMRTDTPQHFAGVLVEDCCGTCAAGLRVGAWTQYADCGGRTSVELMSYVDGVRTRGNVLEFRDKPVRIARDDGVFAVSGLAVQW